VNGFGLFLWGGLGGVRGLLFWLELLCVVGEMLWERLFRGLFFLVL
jgi:hypothetical protein